MASPAPSLWPPTFSPPEAWGRQNLHIHPMHLQQTFIGADYPGTLQQEHPSITPSGWYGHQNYLPLAAVGLPPSRSVPRDAKAKIRGGGKPEILYNALFLFLPYFYRSRVHQVLRLVHLTETEIISLYTNAAPQGSGTLKYWAEVKKSWNDFIDSTLREWKTLNIVSALLLTAIYNVLQLGAHGNGVVQCAALMSLISALMSLIFGCLYLIRFENMRRPYKAMQWASDALNNSGTWWNVHILLALPSVWLAWALISFVVCLMAIVWQPNGLPVSGSGLGPLPLYVKIVVSVLFLIGTSHLSLILSTFAGYGSTLDRTWAERLNNLVFTPPPVSIPPPSPVIPSMQTAYHVRHRGTPPHAPSRSPWLPPTPWGSTPVAVPPPPSASSSSTSTPSALDIPIHSPTGTEITGNQAWAPNSALPYSTQRQGDGAIGQEAPDTTHEQSKQTTEGSEPEQPFPTLSPETEGQPPDGLAKLRKEIYEWLVRDLTDRQSEFHGVNARLDHLMNEIGSMKETAQAESRLDDSLAEHTTPAPRQGSGRQQSHVRFAPA